MLPYDMNIYPRNKECDIYHTTNYFFKYIYIMAVRNY